jgi:hypothetical protein
MTDEMLPDTEWPGRTVLDVSVETTDSGLGMYSKVSENPTLFRPAGFEGCSTGTGTGVEPLTPSRRSSGTGDGDRSVSTGLSRTGRLGPDGRSETVGLVGALLPLALGVEGGTMIEERSWLEIAAERRWAWPRRGVVA